MAGKMKDSNVEWIGEIPEGWEVRKLKYIARMKSGESITAALIENQGEYPVYGGNGLRGFTDAITHEGKHILIGRQGALCGNVHLVEGKFWASEHAIVVSVLENYLTNWCCSVLQAMNLNQYSESAAQPGISVDRVLNLSVPVPPGTMQQPIVEYLETKCAEIDAVIAAKQKQNDLLKKQRQAIIYEAVTKGLDTSAKYKDSGVEWIGEIPVEWEATKNKYLFSIKSGEFISNEKIVDDGRFPIVGGNGVMGYSEEYNCETPTIAIGRVGALCGNVHLIENQSWISDNALLLFDLSRSVNLKYLYFVLQTINLNQYASITAQPLITGTLVKNLYTPLPEVAVQVQIVNALELRCQAIDAVISSNDAIIAKLKEYRQSIIYEAVTGKIAV